jgi:hypothetical protein
MSTPSFLTSATHGANRWQPVASDFDQKMV